MGPYFQQPRKKINQKTQGEKKLAGGHHMYPPPRHLVVKKRHSQSRTHRRLLVPMRAVRSGCNIHERPATDDVTLSKHNVLACDTTWRGALVAVRVERFQTYYY